ncbi:MAG: hypothetical protein KGL31_06990 [candidate division NC10 bacterium]|nr:hypothetical protein [candidate division NC10 bacterium]
MKVALVQEPIEMTITDSDTLLEHSKIMTLRSQHWHVLNTEVEAAQRAVDQAEYQVKKAKLALEAVQLGAEQVAQRERQAITDFFTKARQVLPQMKILQERYGRGVNFMFDSDEHRVWIIAIFSNDAEVLSRGVQTKVRRQPSTRAPSPGHH